MKKNILIIGTLVVVIGISTYAFFVKNSTPLLDQVINTQPPEKDPSSDQPIAMCYRYEKKMASGYSDRAILKMNISGPGGNTVTGEYNNLPAEKDSKVGTFTGTIGPMDPKISARTADVWWDVMAEGMRATEQLRIVFGEGSAAAQFGEMVDDISGNYIYKDVTQLTSGFQMSQVDCQSLN